MPTKGNPTHSKLSSEPRLQRVSNTSPVLIPDDDADYCKLFAADVLCGRERTSTTHVGNKRFRQMIIKKRESFQKATSQGTRLSVAEEVMTMVGEIGGRFLRRNEKSGHLEEMEDGLARELIQKAFQYVPKIPKPCPPAMMIRTISQENQSSGDEVNESKYQHVLSNQRKIFEALMAKQGMKVPE
ncbi:MAG: hypothetical protein SGBAC_010410 [Bacillariaceae sp.]